MKKLFITLFISMLILSGCGSTKSETTKEANKVEMQLRQYAKSQPIPMFNWSLERHLLTELYKLRNKKVSTHAVWRSDYGMIEGDCPSMGYGLPYDTSLTNPLVATRESLNGWNGNSLTAIEQQEPNGVYASKNTSATWVMCIGEAGAIEPVYIESKVTIYPGPVIVDYDKNKVTRSGAATVLISKN